MSPRSLSTPGKEVESGQPSSEDEARPSHTSEIGTLKKLPNQGTAWLGSSSGVYFVNTVRRAFSAAFAPNSSNDVPASEDILTGEDGDGYNYNGPLTTGPSATDQIPRFFAAALGRPPERKMAMELVTRFFEAWHPLFPFLHGPSFLKDLESLYRQSSNPIDSHTSSTSPDVRKAITFQLVINIASLDRNDIQLPEESRIKSTADVARVAGLIALDHGLATIQALLAANLYLVATMAIRHASTVSGIIVKLIYHAGLHRCPLRYAQLSLEDCEIRKRIFWSAYALDRHCNLSLGDPNTIQDDDIDVCLSGRELHKAVARDHLDKPDQEIASNTAGSRAGPANASVSEDPRLVSQGPEARQKELREAALTAFVRWGKLTGNIIEIFHKSINHRFPKQEQILYLTSDIESWWNELPGFLTGEDTTDDAPPQQHLSSFFKILYHRLLLLVSRPKLSLDQSTPEFQHGLQVCIRASRNILRGLKSHQEHGQSMFLPGLLSAAWMSGLIIAFACQLGKYPKNRACSDIHTCLSILDSMNTRWYTVKNCHKVLSLLLANILSRRASTNGLLAVMKPDHPSPQSTSANDGTETQPRKRQRTGNEDFAPISPPKGSYDGNSSATESPLQYPSSMPMTSAMGNGAPSGTINPRMSTRHSFSMETSSMSNFDPTIWDNGKATSSRGLNTTMGAALYANPQDMAFARSNMGLPELPNSSNNSDDPMFWGNMDYNLADVFGSATWEVMTGPFAPNTWDQNMQ